MPRRSRADDKHRNLQEENEAHSAGLPAEEPRNVRKAGGGTVGPSMGGALTGRYGPHPTKVGNREPKPRGRDKR